MISGCEIFDFRDKECVTGMPNGNAGECGLGNEYGLYSRPDAKALCERLCSLELDDMVSGRLSLLP